MKLSNRTSIYFTALSLLVFSIGGIVFYYEIRTNTRQDADERLNFEKQKIVAFLKLHNSLPAQSVYLGDSVAFHQIPASAGYKRNDSFSDTVLYSLNEKESEPYRMLKFVASDTSGYYQVIIFKPLIETDDLTYAILSTIFIIAVALIVALVLAHNFIIKKVWMPFYKILNEIAQYDITKGNSVQLADSSIEEFHELKGVLEEMMDKISSDYRSLKEFTENASHEIQTPLAIIQSKLELLIQSENLNAQQAENLKTVYEAASRLSKLSQALLLLTKIENNQFVENKEVLIDDLAEEKVGLYEELLDHRNIEVELNYTKATVNMHPALADILITNLISNAIKHNKKGGKIYIDIKEKKMVVQNTGEPLSVPGHTIFQRFKKSNQSSDSLGLGLAIAREICRVYSFGIQYDYVNNLHTITVDFK